jgi:hypothetical protein
MDSALMFAAYQAEQDKLRQQPEQENNLVDALGKAALAAGVATAGILGGRRFFAGRGAAPTSVRNTSATTDLSNINVNNLRRASGRPPVNVTETVVPSRPAPRPVPQTTVERLGDANEITRQARSERPQGIKFVDLSDEVRTSVDPLLSPAAPDAADRLLNDPYILSRVNKEYNVEQEAKELAVDNLLSSNRAEQARQQAQKRRSLTESADEIISSLRSEANTAQAAAQGDFTQEYLKTAGYKDVDTMVDQQVANVPRNTNQTLNAIDAAEDQQTGRVYQQLQRNEDLDLNQVEIMEDMARANRKAMMEGGEPTQMIGYEADVSINQVASQLPDGLPVDQAEGASNAAQKFVSEALKKQRSPRAPLSDLDNKMYDLVATAAESGLKLEPNRALSILTDPSIELTTNEINLFKIDPKVGKFALKGQGYGPGQQQTGAMLSLKGEQLENIPNIGLDPQSLITQPASGTSIRGRSRVQNEPEVFRQRRDSLGRPITEDVFTVDEGGTVTISTGKELTELDIPEKFNEEDFPRSFAKDPITGQRQQIYTPKGKRAVSTKEGKIYYVPIQDPGGIGIYGEERSYASGPITKYNMPEEGRVAGEYTKAAMRKPTELPFKEKAPGGTRFSALNNEQLNAFILSEKSKGKVREAGIKELADRQAGAQSILVSEALRRGNIEGRDPQMILKQFGIGG